MAKAKATMRPITTGQPLHARSRAALSLALAAGILTAPLTRAGTATASPAVACASARPGLATRLSRDVTAALRGRSVTAAVALHDHTTGTRCTLRGDQWFDSASVVKVTVLAALLRDARTHHRLLTRHESQLATAMITRSDNAATTVLWRRLGVTRVRALLRLAGMTRTVPGDGGHWGLTRITAKDEQKLLELLTHRNPVLGSRSRAYALGLMRRVVASQRWGTPAGAPRGTTIQVKNGWLPRATHGWRVHSIGAFTGRGHDYTITVLTQDNATMAAGVATVQAVARAVHRGLGSTAGAVEPYAPARVPREAPPVVPWSFVPGYGTAPAGREHLPGRSRTVRGPYGTARTVSAGRPAPG
ncbi:serine hydrolase [Streptomyces sp. NPDC021212]|uniref:serine hydrolase n=1 Tax=Streptomyces sp. NPDC021212 TaxID=3365118 RepID=UPI0037B4B8B8